MAKFVALALLLIVTSVSGFLAYRYSNNPKTLYPYPYKTIQIDPNEISQAEEATVLIVGDSATEILEKHLPQFRERTAKLIKDPLKIYNWGRRGENLAHVLAKLKSLKKLPSLIIFHGGLDELDRRRFFQESTDKIFKNIQITKNPEYMTTLMGAPVLSPFAYFVHKRPSLQEGTLPYSSTLNPMAVQKSLEILYEVFRWEATELFTYLKIRDARVWVIPQAFNLERKPIRVCENANSSDAEKLLKHIEKLLSKNKTKDAYNLLKEFISRNQGHSLAYYWLGKTFLKLGQNLKAKKSFYQALIFDCSLTRSNPVLTKILIEESEKRGFKIIDFNRMVTNQLGHNVLFFSEREPQDLYYERLINELYKSFQRFIKNY